jgi:hypothetical protein
VVDAADYVVAQQIVLGKIQPTAQDLARGDLYPPGAPDGVIDLPDMLLLLNRVR